MKPKASMRLAACLGVALLCAPPLHAQQGPNCPKLPADSGLKWQEIRNPDLLFCKAMDAGGNQMFSVMVSNESPFEPVRSRREEALSVNGRSTWWYRTQIATRPNVLAREAAVELGNGNVAYFNVQADDAAELRQTLSTVAALGF